MKVDPDVAARLMNQGVRFGRQEHRPLGLVLTRADAVAVWDVQGNRYLDFTGGDGTVGQGHNHTRIAAAMVEQCLRLAHGPLACYHDRLPPLLAKLCSLTGFEAAVVFAGEDGALEVARAAARNWGVQARGLDPRSAELIEFSDLGPADPGGREVPFGDLTATQAAVRPGTCAILVEPFQGRDGIRPPPRGFLRGLRELCDARGLLLLADERRSGLGRTGRLFGFEHEGIRPDAAILGNALSGGFYPAGALLASRAIVDRVPPDGPGPPQGAHPLACAVISAALDVLTEERLADRSAELGAYFLARLRAMDGSRVQAIRGQGLWAALELGPGAGPAREVCGALAREGLLCSGHGDVLELCPPLVVSREQLDWALEKLERALG